MGKGRGKNLNELLKRGKRYFLCFFVSMFSSFVFVHNFVFDSRNDFNHFATYSHKYSHENVQTLVYPHPLVLTPPNMDNM